jgi:hypothetical protein
MSDLIQEQGVQEAPLTRYCRRCHRKLKSKKAMRLGYGKICALKVRPAPNERRGLMARSRDFLMAELRKAQKALASAKRRRNPEQIKYLRLRIADLQKEMERAE